MAFRKGDKKPDISGRKPGSINKTTRETKEVIADLLQLTAPIYAAKMTEKANSDNPAELKDFLDRYERLIEFGVPKLQRSEIKAEIKTEILDSILKAFDGVDDG